MPKVKIPRKSTFVDMTAMCDVAFLLLSFFILATKQKPEEVLAVTPPNSISSTAAPDEAILITMTKDGRAFLTLGDETKKQDVLDDINKVKGLNLTPAEMNKWSRARFIGMPLAQTKGLLAQAGEPNPADMPGIPIDSANNEMVDWMRSVTNAYAGGDQKELEKILLIKGDNSTLYPVFKQVKEAFKKNEIYKFRIVTNSEAIPIGSELYNQPRAEK